MAEIVGYYQFDPDINELHTEDWECPFFTLVTKERWDTEHLLEDDGIDPDLIPDGFYELTGSTFEFEHVTVEEAKKALEEKGWVEKDLYIESIRYEN